jgi:A/G-specific adenine glycosylase
MKVAGAAKARKRSEAPASPEASALLDWYDRHRRRLPWRAQPGQKPDPYHVWLSEIMLQQTTVKAVGPYYLRFLQHFPDVHALAAAERDEVLRLWAGLGYYARARNLHACAQAVVSDHGGRFPDAEEILLTLPGVGTYTAAAIAAIAFDRPATLVDGNIERVVSRLYAIEEELPAAKQDIRALAAKLTPAQRTGDFAQAMMDLGATICTPKNPACALCPWSDACVAHTRGTQEEYPRKSKKQKGKLRRGAAYVAVRADGHILVRTRPDEGLLGGMAEVPTTKWTHDFDEADAIKLAPFEAKWQCVSGVVTHVFTHFPLELAVFVARVPLRMRPPRGARFVSSENIHAEALPGVMRKVLTLAGLGDLMRPTKATMKARKR